MKLGTKQERNGNKNGNENNKNGLVTRMELETATRMECCCVQKMPPDSFRQVAFFSATGV
jgi:hypothetical protein